jgi:hypothetical protein
VCWRDQPSVHSTRNSSSHADFGTGEWRDPDSNRGHHDFQKAIVGAPRIQKDLQIRINDAPDGRAAFVRNMRGFGG